MTEEQIFEISQGSLGGSVIDPQAALTPFPYPGRIFFEVLLVRREQTCLSQSVTQGTKGMTQTGMEKRLKHSKQPCSIEAFDRSTAPLGTS